MRLLALGDLHGDSEALLIAAEAFGLVDRSKNWCAPDVHLIQMGDVCDRGSDSRKIYEYLMLWQKQAPESGSRVTFLLGNHEAMNVFGFRTYVNTLDYAGYASYPGSSGREEYTAAFSEGGLLYEWLALQHAVVREGPFVFGHGDLPVMFANLSCEEYDRMTMEAFRESPKDLPSELLPPILFSETRSVLWCRQAYTTRLRDYGSLLEEFLDGNGASVYVCGHTPSDTGAFRILYGGRYVCIDTAMVWRSTGAGSVSALLYENGIAEAWYGDGVSERRERLDLPLPT